MEQWCDVRKSQRSFPTTSSGSEREEKLNQLRGTGLSMREREEKLEETQTEERGPKLPLATVQEKEKPQMLLKTVTRYCHHCHPNTTVLSPSATLTTATASSGNAW
jgi:hypothetical protein